MKSYTDLEQSKKLAEILPIESADMAWYPSYAKDGYSIRMLNDTYPLDIIGDAHDEIPAWSLVALLEQFEDTAGLAKDYGLWFCYDNRKSYCTKHYDNPIDACVEIIYKLKEKELI
jgi:hypothetical protein